MAIRTGILTAIYTLALAGAAASVAQAKPAMRQPFLLGLEQRGEPANLSLQVSNPSSASYRHFLTVRDYRARFAPPRSQRRAVRRYLGRQAGVRRVEASSDRSVFLTVVTAAAAKRLFCANPANRRVCIPRPLRQRVQLISAGEQFQPGGSRSGGGQRASSGTPSGCAEGTASGAFAPNQLSTAYGVDPMRARGLDGSGIRAVTLSSQEVDPSGFATWARCFGLPTPNVRQIAMPSATKDTGTAPEETVLDVEALAAIAPGLQSITPIYVPLDQSFSNSLPLFMLGALDRSRQRGKLPHVLSISDGVCEDRFTDDQIELTERFLVQAAALGITVLAASGDLGFEGCQTPKPGANFPSSSPFVTSVGGTELTLTPANEIADQVVWSTFGTDPNDNGVGTGGGPSAEFGRPAFQTAPGIDSSLQPGKPTRLAPDVASMGSFAPGISVYDAGGGGWGLGGGTSTATPLTASVVALALEQERTAHRARLGLINPLLYELASGAGYSQIFSDVVTGTSSPQPATPVGQTPAGGAAQPGYDLATGLGSLNATAFADAIAAHPPAP